MRWLIFLLLLLPYHQADAAWFSGNWDYRVKVEIAPDKVGSSTAVTSFPVYLDLVSLPTDFWTNIQEDGDDIRIVENDEVTETAFELVSIATTTKTGELHFMADSLGTTSSSTFYIYYGNASATAYAVSDTYGRNAVWSNYIRVYHGNSTTDSSGNSNVTLNAQTTAQTSNRRLGDYSFNIASAQTTIPINAGSITGRTVSAWVRPASSASNNYVWDMRTGLVSGYLIFSSGLNYEIGADFTYAYKDSALATNGVTTWTDNTYHHVVGRTNAQWTDTGVSFGFRYASVGASDTLTGQFDEIRVTTSIDTSTSTIITEYNNQSATSTFYWIGSPEGQGGNEVTVYPSSTLKGGVIIKGGATIK